MNLGAVDGLSRWLVLRSGRLPRTCTADDCELVQIGGAPVAPKLPYLHVVGRATIRAGAPLAAYFAAAGANRPPILLADGVRGFSRLPLPDAALIARTAGWIVPVAPGAIHEWEIPGFQRRLDLAQNRLESADPLFSLAAPTDTLREIRATTRIAGRRLLIVGGDAAILLLGFAVLASTRLRRDHRAVRRRLRWFGAQRSQVTLVAATEVLAITVVATVAGWLLGTGAGALLARHLGAPGAAAVAHSVVTARGLLVAVVLAVLDRRGDARRRARRAGLLRRAPDHDRGRRGARSARRDPARARAREGRRRLARLRRRHRHRAARPAGAADLRPRGRRGAAARARAAAARARGPRRARVRAHRAAVARTRAGAGDPLRRLLRRRRQRRRLRDRLPRDAADGDAGAGAIRGSGRRRAPGGPAAARVGSAGRVAGAVRAARERDAGPARRRLRHREQRPRLHAARAAGGRARVDPGLARRLLVRVARDARAAAASARRGRAARADAAGRSDGAAGSGDGARRPRRPVADRAEPARRLLDDRARRAQARRASPRRPDSAGGARRPRRRASRHLPADRGVRRRPP